MSTICSTLDSSRIDIAVFELVAEALLIPTIDNPSSVPIIFTFPEVTSPPILILSEVRFIVLLVESVKVPDKALRAPLPPWKYTNLSHQIFSEPLSEVVLIPTLLFEGFTTKLSVFIAVYQSSLTVNKSTLSES